MKRGNAITSVFLDIGGVLLTNGWDHLARKRAAVHFKLKWAEMEDRHNLSFATYEEGKLTLRAVMAVLSTLPAVGAFLIWAPAAGFLLMQGYWVRALVVVIWGMIVIHPVDNVLYPVLVGAKLGLHPLLLFIAFVGGLLTFGAPGLILGPAVVALTIGLGEIWTRRLTPIHD